MPRLTHEALLATVQRVPDKTALIDERRYSYSDLLRSSCWAAQRLRNYKINRGDRVALLLNNSWEFAVSVYATWLAGGVVVAINPVTPSRKIKDILSDSGSKIIVTSSTACDKRIEEAVSDTRVLPVPSGSLGINGEYTCELNQSPSIPCHEYEARGTIPVDLAALIYTSGTTGVPKGVMISHQNVVFTVDSVVESLSLRAEDIILGVLPMSFSYGFYQLLMSVKLGATLVVKRSMAFTAQLSQTIEENRISVVPAVPAMLSRFLQLFRTAGVRLECPRIVTTASAPLPVEWISDLHRLFPRARIYNMYGLTECKRVSCMDPGELISRPGSVGKAIPGTEVLVLDEMGREVQAGTPGILHVRGQHLMVGYWGKPQLTKETIVEGNFVGDRVLKTNDWFERDADGYLYYLGRNDDMLNIGGRKVSPVEIENALCAIPGVQEAALVAIEGIQKSHIPFAFVTLSDPTLSEVQIKAFCREFLESDSVPRRIKILGKLPRSPNGKIMKRTLHRMALRLRALPGELS